MADINTAEIGIPIHIPTLDRDSMKHSSPFVAAPAHQEALGFPGELVDDWQAKAIDKLGELLKGSRALQVYMDSCVKCGACTDKCHYFLGSGDPKNMPVARQDPVTKSLSALLHAGGQIFSVARRRGRPDRRSAGRLVHVLSPVLTVSAVFGLLPLWYRYGGSFHGCARDHGSYR